MPSDPPVKGEVLHQAEEQEEQGAEQGAEKGAEQWVGQDFVGRLYGAVHLPPSGYGGRGRGGHCHTLSSNVLKNIKYMQNHHS